MQISDSIKRLSMLAALIAGCLAATWIIFPKVARWNQQNLASKLATKINLADDDKVRVPLRQLASLGTAAIPKLVAASASKRTTVAEQARQIINENFESWCLQSEVDRNFDLAVPITTLAAALAKHVDLYGPRGKRWAESLTLLLIESAETVPANLTPQMLEDCTHILASIPASGPRLRNVSTTQILTPANLRQSQTIPNIPLSAFALSSETVITPSRPAPINLKQGVTAFNALPSTTHLPQPSPSSHTNWSPDWINGKPPNPQPASVTAAPVQLSTPPLPPLPVPASQPRNSNSQLVDIPSPAQMNQQMKRLRQKTSPELVRLLPRNDIFAGGPIRAVLHERGLTDSEMNLTQQYSSEKVIDRLQLIDDLSVLPAATARRWLHWLLEDKDAEVRLRALTAIATTADPTLYELARNLAVHDKDTRVAELASRIMKEAR